MDKHHPLPNPSRYKWDTEQVTVYQIPIDEKLYQEKLATVGEALYKMFTSGSEWEFLQLPTDSILSPSHQGQNLQTSNEGIGLSNALEKEPIYEKAA